MSFNNCMECGELLLKRTKIRDTPKMCADCRGNKSNGNSQMRKLFIELSKRKIETTEDEMWFDDIGKKAKAKAEMEDEIGRINKTSSMEARETTLGELF